MHSGANVEAFQAAMNRDIEGHASTSQPSLSNTGNHSQFLLFLFFSQMYIKDFIFPLFFIDI